MNTDWRKLPREEQMRQKSIESVFCGPPGENDLALRLSRTNREISGGTAGNGTETEEAKSMASRPNRDLPGQSDRIRIVGMS